MFAVQSNIPMMNKFFTSFEKPEATFYLITAAKELELEKKYNIVQKS